MSLLATLTLACLGMSPQGGAAPQQPLLSAQEQKSLQSKLAKLIETRTEYDMAPGSNPRQREKAMKAYEQAKDAFNSEWKSRLEKKGNLLGSMPDLEAIFSNVITYERKSGVTIRKVPEKDGIPEHCLYVPKGYKADAPLRTVLLMPGNEGGHWEDGVKWYDACWGKKNPLEEDTIFHVPVFSDDLDLDPVPDYTSVQGEALEFRRNGELMRSFGETQRNYNIDRARLFLDAGKGACGFALRVATHFPDRFAGLVLRHPTAVDEIRLGSLLGVPVLMLSSPATADVCKALKQRLDAIDPALCTILDGKGDYPFRDSAADIEGWMQGVRRVVNRKRVVLEPNDDRFKKGYWVDIDRMDSIHTAPADKKPRLVAEVDREQNRLKVEAVGIERVVLYLNDALLDLDKPFTIVVNDKAMTEQRTREFNQMLEYALRRFDCEYLFPVKLSVDVPRPDAHPTEAGGAK